MGYAERYLGTTRDRAFRRCVETILEDLYAQLFNGTVRESKRLVYA